MTNAAAMRKTASARPIDFAVINQAALASMDSLLRQILPGGQIRNGEYVALNPTRADRHLGSFTINIRTGRWADFATGDKGGDVISLVAYVRGIRQSKAAGHLAALLGVNHG